MTEQTSALEEICDRLRTIEQRLSASQSSPPQYIVEQYKIVFSVIVSLNDNVVKSMLTMLIIYFAITAVALRAIPDFPQMAKLLYVNYFLIIFFFYYLAYLRFRILVMFKIAEEIENSNDFSYRGMTSYEDKTNYRLFSTKGLFFFIMGTIIAINTFLIYTVG